MTDQEFDQMASWTVDAIERLGPDHAVAGACRGSGGPGAMGWLSQWLLDGGATPFLDLGGGLGGPSAWLGGHHEVSPIVAEPMAGAVHGARRLFGLPVVQADGVGLPFADASFAAAWCLGVLSTAPDGQGILDELTRVVRPDGHVGLVAYVATGSQSVDEPDGNHFPTWSELTSGLASAGLTMHESSRLSDLAAAGPQWDRLADAVDEDIAHHHAAEPEWRRARADEDHVAHMLQQGSVEGHALRLTARGSSR